MVNSSIDGLPVSSNRVIEQGDYIEAIDPLDRRFSADTHKETVLMQQAESVKIRRNTAWATLLINDSNHPWKYIRTIGNLTVDLCDRLIDTYNTPVIYGNWHSVVSFVDRRKELMFKIHSYHGRKSISSTSPDYDRRQAYKRMRLKKLCQQSKLGDCVLHVRGHTHEQLLVEPISDHYIADDGKDLHKIYKKVQHREEYLDPDLCWYVSPGSFLKAFGLGVDGYAAQFENEPLELGFALAKVRNRTIKSVEFVKV